MSVNQKQSFLLYLEHEEFLNELSDQEAGELIKALFEYVRTGQTPSLSPIVKMVFISIRQDLDRNAEKYEAKTELLRLNGAKGGRPKKSDKPVKEKEEEQYEKEEVQEQEQEKEKEEKNSTVVSENQKVIFKNQKNQKFFLKTFYDNDNVNDNVNVNEISLSQERKITESEREILEKYIEKHKLATKNVKAYASKLISNGDWINIVDGVIQKTVNKALKKSFAKEDSKSRDEVISEELSVIKDKRSCAKILAGYYVRGSPPGEFDEVMKKYDLDTYDKMAKYAWELKIQKQTEPP